MVAPKADLRSVCVWVMFSQEGNLFFGWFGNALCISFETKTCAPFPTEVCASGMFRRLEPTTRMIWADLEKHSRELP